MCGRVERLACMCLSAWNAPKRSGGQIRRSRTRRVRKHPREVRTNLAFPCRVPPWCLSVRGKCRRNLTRHAVRAAWPCARPAPQSEDCVRGRSLRHATLPAWRGRLSAAAFPAQHVWSAPVLGHRRRGASPPPRICLFPRLRHASADARPARSVAEPPVASGRTSAAPVAPGRRCALAPMRRSASPLCAEKRGRFVCHVHMSEVWLMERIAQSVHGQSP